MMNVLVCLEPGNFEYQEREIPQPGKGQAIIRIKRVGICGTDLHAFEGTQPYFHYPRILGHELAAEFIASPDNTAFQKGDMVTIIPYFHCGQCIACRSGKPNCCVEMKVCGVHVDGGMSEYLIVPVNSLIHAGGLSADELALTEPLAIGAHGVDRAGVVPGEDVLVIGAGPIGLGAMELARIAGANVIAWDIREERLQFCKDRLGVQQIINAASPDAKEQLKSATHNNMPTVVIDATGNLSAINNGFSLMAHGARYVLIGLQKGDIQFSHPEFHKREGTLLSSRNATRENFEQVMTGIRSKQLIPSNYITHRVSFNNLAKEFPSWLDPRNGVIKAMVEFD